MSQFDLSKFMQMSVIAISGINGNTLKVQAIDADAAVQAFGHIGDEATYTIALDRALSGCETIGEADDLSAEGYYGVLGAAMKSPMFRMQPPQMVARAAVQAARMQNIMRAGTDRQAKEMLRPNVFLTMEFDHVAPGPLVISEKPTIAGVPTNYRDAPLSLRQTPIFLESGQYASAKIIFEVAELRSVKLAAPAGGTPPAGTLIQRWSPATYQAGLAPPALRDTDEVTLLTEFKCISTASAPVKYQVNWEFRADMGFGAGSRCISTRGASLVRGASRITG